MILPDAALAQTNLERLDFSRIEVEDLTDEQLRELLARAEAQGLSQSELEKMALARGMRPSEVVKFRERLYRLQLVQGAESAGRSRNEARDPDDPFEILVRSRNRFLARDSTAAPSSGDSLRKRVFGEDLFDAEMLTFEPSLDIPTPRDYRLGPGDELVVDIWGAAEMTYRETISREGAVRLPNVGPIYVNGQTVEEAERRIVGRLGAFYAGLSADGTSGAGTYADVTLGKVRSIKVHILGEVKRPGSYTLPALSNVFNALYVCGGPNESGTFRAVQVIRNGEVVGVLDVYDFLIYGRQTQNVVLQDQDIIKVDPYLTRVELQGRVKRPALFEMRASETLSDLLHFAGGFAGDAYTRHLRVYRNTETERAIIHVEDDEYDGFALYNGDSVAVGPILQRFANRVEIRGAVYRKGDYELEDARTVYGLIQRAEGIRGDAFTSRAHIYRTRDDLTVELLSFNLGALLRDPARHDVPLHKDDIVVIPSIFELKEETHVTVEGSVKTPGEYPYMENMTLQDLIVMAEGLRDEASVLRIEVSRRRAESDSLASGRIADIFQFDLDRGLKLGPEDARFRLAPFDQVYVRKSPGYIEQRSVRIAGEVLYPGTYTIESKDDRISDLVERAGGLTPEAYPLGARLIRTQNAVGPVGINLDRILAQKRGPFDLLVENGDSLFVPLRLETVKVTGAVYFPVSVPFSARMDLRDYVSRAGGTTDMADLSRAYVVYANGSIDRVRPTVFFTRYPEIEPGTEIVVPARPARERMSAEERTLILSSVVSIAAVVSTTIFQLTR